MQVMEYITTGFYQILLWYTVPLGVMILAALKSKDWGIEAFDTRTDAVVLTCIAFVPFLNIVGMFIVIVTLIAMLMRGVDNSANNMAGWCRRLWGDE